MGFLPARDKRHNFDGQLRVISSQPDQGFQNRCGSTAKRKILKDGSRRNRDTQAAIQDSLDFRKKCILNVFLVNCG